MIDLIVGTVVFGGLFFYWRWIVREVMAQRQERRRRAIIEATRKAAGDLDAIAAGMRGLVGPLREAHEALTRFHRAFASWPPER